MENEPRQHMAYPNVTVGPRTTGEPVGHRWPVSQGYPHGHMMRPAISPADVDPQYRNRMQHPGMQEQQQQYIARTQIAPPGHYPPGHPGNMVIV